MTMHGGASWKRRLLLLAPFVVLAALLASCGGGDDKPSEGTFPGNTWLVEYTRSGGIAGMIQGFTLDHKGNVTTEDKRANTTKQGKVSDIGDVQKLLRAANLPTLQSDRGFPRPDAFVTSFNVTSDGKTYSLTFVGTPQAPEVAALLTRLGSVYDENKP
jgi:hypothetical protein